MARKSVTKLVEDILESYLIENEYELVDVEFVKEGPHRYLRVYVDHENGISLDDCEKISGYLNEKLDKLDPIEENYFLEVSSPGIDRPLKKEADFVRFKGRKVEAKLYQTINSQKVILGELVGLEDGEVTIIDEVTNLEVKIPRDKIAIIRLVVEF